MTTLLLTPEGYVKQLLLMFDSVYKDFSQEEKYRLMYQLGRELERHENDRQQR